MIIDKTISDYNDVPSSLEGEVLLERTVDGNGRATGYLTCSVDQFIAMKNASPSARASGGWDRLSSLLDSADATSLRTAEAVVQARRVIAN